MDKVVKGVLNFRKNVFPEHKDLFGTLADGQNPDILFITCSDSRIDPSLLTGSNPGDLFICRNAGNIIPPHSNETGGMTAQCRCARAQFPSLNGSDQAIPSHGADHSADSSPVHL